NLNGCLDKLGEYVCSYIVPCLSQGRVTDSKLQSLKSRLEGKPYDDDEDSALGLLDHEGRVSDHCDHERKCLSELAHTLCIDAETMKSSESAESTIVNVATVVCSLLDLCSEYMRIVDEYRCAVLCCVLRVCELSEWRESVREIEQSEAEMEKIKISMDKYKRDMKGKKMKLATINHDLESLKRQLSGLASSAMKISKSKPGSFQDDSESDDDSYSDEYKEGSVDDLKQRIQELTIKSEKLSKKIQFIRTKMNKRFHRCIELQQHATRLANVGFTIPQQLDVTYLQDSELGSDHSIPLIFSTGIALGMFSEISQISSSSNPSNGLSKGVVGGFQHEGNVFTAKWEYHEEKVRDVVLKFIDIPKDLSSATLSRSHYRSLLRSAISARTCGQDCAYIIPLLGVFYDEHVLTPSKTGAYLVFPFYSNGDLSSWMSKKSRSVSSIQHVLKCVLHALAHLHHHNIIHCDLKPQNILIDSDGNGVLCDFEGAVDCSDRTMNLLSQTMRVGTHKYIAPELQLAISSHSHPHPAPHSDMFSFGILLQDVFDMLYTEASRSDEEMRMPPEVCEIRDACLSETPEDRPTALQILAHKWFI
ncbi:hypothetical protein ADUPG1_010239, partial [Aduncisulcus paluster]